MTKENFRQTRPEKTERRAQWPQCQQLWELYGHQQFQDLKENQTRGSHEGGDYGGAGGGARAKAEKGEGLAMGELKCRSVKGCESTRAPTFKILKIYLQFVVNIFVIVINMKLVVH